MKKLFFLWIVVSMSLLGPFNASAQESSVPNASELSNQEPLTQNLLHTKSLSSRANDYPIILVHGLVGWGRDEFLGYRYWGGLIDIEDDLNDYGYETHTAAVGPFSSNWDRASELYAQIKGGTVDYGEAHSKEHGHDRYGRTYEGFYPEWGEMNPETGEINKVHLVGHSLGGQTIRVLTQLLAEGNIQEQELTELEQLSPLFDSEQESLVSSVFTISSPHDGSSATRLVDGLFPMTKDIIALAASSAGNTDSILYDFKLDQWGLKRGVDESFEDYAEKVYNSSIWYDTKDTAEWDTSPEGAMELNSWVGAQEDTYYFSVSTEQSYESIWSGHHKPELFMNPIFYLTSSFLGGYSESGDININHDWWENDGVVNTNSMDGPTLGSSDEIVYYNGNPQKGTWNHIGEFHSVDHLDIIGIGLYDVRDWYRSVADLLGSLQ